MLDKSRNVSDEQIESYLLMELSAISCAVLEKLWADMSFRF